MEELKLKSGYNEKTNILFLILDPNTSKIACTRKQSIHCFYPSIYKKALTSSNDIGPFFIYYVSNLILILINYTYISFSTLCLSTNPTVYKYKSYIYIVQLVLETSSFAFSLSKSNFTSFRFTSIFQSVYFSFFLSFFPFLSLTLFPLLFSN